MKRELDFLIVGAQKAGTTSLFEYARLHPALHFPAGKERSYFSNNLRYRNGWEAWLEQTFGSGAPEDKLWGGADPQYLAGSPMHDAADSQAVTDLTAAQRGPEFVIPSRIRAQLPSVKLIAILRDPVERSFSHYQMNVLLQQETRSFDDVVDELTAPSGLVEARSLPTMTNSYLAWGEYGRTLGAFYDEFPSEQILVLFTRDLEQDPESMLHRVFTFLGVDASFVPDNLGVKYRAGSSRRRIQILDFVALQESLKRLRLLKRIWHALPPRTRGRIDRRRAALQYKLELWNRVEDARENEMSPAARAKLEAHFGPDRERLAALLGTALPW